MLSPPQLNSPVPRPAIDFPDHVHREQPQQQDFRTLGLEISHFQQEAKQLLQQQMVMSNCRKEFQDCISAYENEQILVIQRLLGFGNLQGGSYQEWQWAEIRQLSQALRDAQTRAVAYKTELQTLTRDLIRIDEKRAALHCHILERLNQQRTILNRH